MEHNMTFDSIWEQEERQGLQQRLRQDYPSWLRRRRTALATVVSVAVVSVAAGITLSTLHSPLSTYDAVACNRSGIAEGHWADVAANILIMNSEI